jgi:hypothetical protein
MSRLAAYKRYKHSLRLAYNALSLIPTVDDASMGFPTDAEVENLSTPELLGLMTGLIKRRLQLADPKLLTEFLEVARTRSVYFNNRQIIIPLLNNQAVEWYETSEVFNFDCVIETFLGMHQGARVIYDIGGHQGIWAAYYSSLCGDGGRVYTFEPSIINFESSCLLFLINDIVNVLNIPFGLGDKHGIVKKRDDTGILVDFVDHNLGILRFDQAFWEPADFIKIDIEGFEYELVRSFPNLFKFCRNMHLEVHVPHLEKRNVDYREIYKRIPFDQVNVFNYQYGKLTKVGPDDTLSGYCSLLISPK